MFFFPPLRRGPGELADRRRRRRRQAAATATAAAAEAATAAAAAAVEYVDQPSAAKEMISGGGRCTYYLARKPHTLCTVDLWCALGRCLSFLSRHSSPASMRRRHAREKETETEICRCWMFYHHPMRVGSMFLLSLPASCHPEANPRRHLSRC